jgi:two-component system, cell cycle sensor histidine kinase and response regulator CckA
MTGPLRILLVEDSENDAQLLMRHLTRNGVEFSLTRVQTGPAMLDALATGTWDLVVSDYSMPQFSASAALETLRSTGLDLPFIIVSGTVGEETAVTALKAGAHDFLPKDRLGRLVPAIQREVREAAERRKLRVAERALSDTQMRMQFAMESAGVGTWEADLASGRTIWSDLLERMHGLEPGSFHGTLEAFIETVHPADREQLQQHISQSLRNQHDFTIEYRTVWPDGSVHWIVTFGRAVSDASGDLTRAAGVSIDVTHQKTLEEQLQQAQKMESIGNLAGGIAHDFNNVLTVVTGYCSFLQDRVKDDPGAVDDVGQIRRAAESATALTRQLLAFSRRQVLAPKVLCLNAVLTDLQKMLRRLIEEHVRIELKLSKDLPLVNVDPGQMEQVVMNLTVNARDAMPEGGVITLETSAVDLDGEYASTQVDVTPGPYVRFSIRDTGTGIPPEILTRVFEPFFTTKPTGQGTGLGLATVFGIVKQSGGHLTVSSEVGVGTTFTIYVPQATAESQVALEQGPLVAGTLNGTETVLIVEDDARLRVLDQRVLARYGYNVLVASSCAEAQRVCTEHEGHIHIVLTDVVMPGGSGKNVSDWVAQTRPSTQVIYMSGYTDNTIMQRGLLTPGTQYLQKPFTPEMLARKVREVLSRVDASSDERHANTPR